jgi:hypothetical protein
MMVKVRMLSKEPGPVHSGLFVAVSVASLQLGWGAVGLAAGATVWMVARTLATGARFLRGHWALQP